MESSTESAQIEDFELSVASETLHLAFLLTILCASVAIFLNLPLYRTVLGGFAFLVLPGILVINLLGMRVDKPMGLLLAVALSVSMLVILGLAIDQSYYHLLAVEQPLATTYLIPSLGLFVITLTAASYSQSRGEHLTLTYFRPSRTELLVIGGTSFLPLFSILSVYYFRITDDNLLFLLLTPFAIVWLVSVILLVRRTKYDLDERTYPVLLLLLSIALFSPMSLKSEYIVGSDVYRFFWVYRFIESQSHWSLVHSGNIYDTTLSTNFLPVVLKRIFGFGDHFLFSFLVPLIFSLSMLAVYSIAKELVEGDAVLFAGFFFASSKLFMYAALTPRTMIALFFSSVLIALAITQTRWNRYPLLFAIFSAIVVMAHYATTFILLYVFSIVYAINLFLRYATNSTEPRFINLNRLAIFSGFSYLWFTQVSTAPLVKGLRSIYFIFAYIDRAGSEETQGSSVQAATGAGILEKGLPHQIDFVVTWIVLGGFAVGLAYLAKNWLLSRTVRSKLIERWDRAARYAPRLERFITNRDVETHLKWTIAAFGVLFAYAFFPYVSESYGTSRTYLFVAIILTPTFVYGLRSLLTGPEIRLVMKRAVPWRPLVIVVLSLFLLSNFGMTYEVANYDRGYVVSDEEFDMLFFPEKEDYQAAHWLGTYRSNDVIYVDRLSYKLRVAIPPKGGRFTRYRSGIRHFDEDAIDHPNSYSLMNCKNADRRLFAVGKPEFVPFKNYDLFEQNKHKIYTNGCAAVLK